MGSFRVFLVLWSPVGSFWVLCFFVGPMGSFGVLRGHMEYFWSYGVLWVSLGSSRVLWGPFDSYRVL